MILYACVFLLIYLLLVCPVIVPPRGKTFPNNEASVAFAAPSGQNLGSLAMSPVVVWCPSLAAKKANPHQSAMSKTAGPNLGDPTSDGRQETVDSSAACPQTRGSRCQICTIVWSLATQLSLHAKQGYQIKGRTSGNEFVQGSPSPWLSKLSANRFLLLTGSEKC